MNILTMKTPSVQVTPDWEELMSVDKFESDFKMKFLGPGLYLSKDDTMLVIREGTNAQNAWHQNSDDRETSIRVHVWNCNIAETVFGTKAPIPTRSDDRE